MSEMKPEQFVGYMFIHVLRLGPRYKDENADPVPTSDWDSPPLSGQAEENHETEKKGEDNLTDDREEEDDARSSCFSREDSCDTGEAKELHPNIKKKKSTLLCGQTAYVTRVRSPLIGFPGVVVCLTKKEKEMQEFV